MIRISGISHLRCNSCGQMYRVNLRDIYFDEAESFEERPMGVGYDHYLEGSMGCQCGAEIKIEIHVSEYPVGCLEIEENRIIGAEYTRQPIVHIVECDDEEYSNNLELNVTPSIKARRTLAAMNSREFELFVGSILVELGYPRVRITKRTRDGGFDFEAADTVRGVFVTIIGECKHYSKNVGVEIIRGLHDVQLRKHANIGMVVTSAFFTRDAWELANEYGMTLWDQSFLIREGIRLGLL